MAKAVERDPILLTEKYLLKQKIMSEADIEKLRAEIQAEVDAGGR